MLGVDNTSEILYHYLRELHVKVSKMTATNIATMIRISCVIDLCILNSY